MFANVLTIDLNESLLKKELVNECLKFFVKLLRDSNGVSDDAALELVNRQWARLPLLAVSDNLEISKCAVSILAEYCVDVPIFLHPDCVCQLIAVATGYCYPGTFKYERVYNKDILRLLTHLDESVFYRTDALLAILEFLYMQLLYSVESTKHTHRVLSGLLSDEKRSRAVTPLAHSSGLVPLLMKSFRERNGRYADSAIKILCPIVVHSSPDQIQFLMMQGILNMICMHSTWRRHADVAYNAVTTIVQACDNDLDLVLKESPGLASENLHGIVHIISIHYKYIALWLSQHTSSEDRNILGVLPIDVAKIIINYI